MPSSSRRSFSMSWCKRRRRHRLPPSFRDVTRSHHLSSDEIRHLAVDDADDRRLQPVLGVKIGRLGNQPHDRFFGRFLIELAQPPRRENISRSMLASHNIAHHKTHFDATMPVTHSSGLGAGAVSASRQTSMNVDEGDDAAPPPAPMNSASIDRLRQQNGCGDWLSRVEMAVIHRTGPRRSWCRPCRQL